MSQVKLHIHSQMQIYSLSNGYKQSKRRKDWHWFSRQTKRKCTTSNCAYTVKCVYIHSQMEICNQTAE